MLQASGLSYTADPRVGPLFENLSLSLLPGEKVALMGVNGAGKTKLLQILAGLLAPNSGSVVLSRGSTVGYLPQDFDYAFSGSLREFVLDEPLALRHLARFHLGSRLDQGYETLSLGERMRAALARLLASEPDILLLDEPTNHLDLEARLWLESFLESCLQGVLMVCHDRAMVNAVVSRVLELEQGSLREYSGGYDDMKQAKQERLERETAAWERERSEKRRLKNAAEKTLQKAARITRKPSGNNYSAASKPFFERKAKMMDRRAKAIRTRVQHMDRHSTAKPFVADALELDFPARPLRSSFPLTVRGLSKSYSSLLFSDLSFEVEAGEKVALMGPNGCGKTTLLRILLGEEAPDSGEVTWESDASVAYLSQSRFTLPVGSSVLEALAPVNAKEEQFARTLLGRLGLRGDGIDKPIGVLSVGERTKVELVKILMTPANVLLLDEPTNHLDVESLEALEEALLDFPGSVLFTSHDRAFVERVSDFVIEL